MNYKLYELLRNCPAAASCNTVYKLQCVVLQLELF